MEENKNKWQFPKGLLIACIIMIVLIIVTLIIVLVLQNKSGASTCSDGGTCSLHFLRNIISI